MTEDFAENKQEGAVVNNLKIIDNICKIKKRFFPYLYIALFALYPIGALPNFRIVLFQLSIILVVSLIFILELFIVYRYSNKEDFEINCFRFFKSFVVAYFILLFYISTYYCCCVDYTVACFTVISFLIIAEIIYIPTFIFMSAAFSFAILIVCRFSLFQRCFVLQNTKKHGNEILTVVLCLLVLNIFPVLLLFLTQTKIFYIEAIPRTYKRILDFMI